MPAKVIKDFPGRADDAAESRKFIAGEIIHGDLARVAVDLGLAKEVDERTAASAAKKAAKKGEGEDE